MSAEELETLRREKEDAEAKLEKISLIWEKAFSEFQSVRESLQEEIEAHAQTQNRLAHNQLLLDTLTKVSSSGLEEYNQLKKTYAKECAIRKELEERLSSSPSSFTSSISREQNEEEVMNNNLSDVYLIPTLTELGERLEKAESELAAATQRAKIAEHNLDRIQNAAVSALDEFNQLKKRFSDEMLRRQEAEKLAMELQLKLDEFKGVKKEVSNDSIEHLRKTLETERQLRKLAENDVSNLTKQLNKNQGKQFDLMTVTELEVKLENASRSLLFSEERIAKLDKENNELRSSLEEMEKALKEKAAPMAAPPPPPPPAPIFAPANNDNFKKRVGALKTKLQTDDAGDQLNDLRAQAMMELQAKLEKRKKETNASTSQVQTGQMDNLASVLEKSRTGNTSAGNLQSANQAFDALEKQFGTR